MRLARWRARLGISQTRAAGILNVDQARYSQFERGRRKPGRVAAVRIERGTGGDVRVGDWDLAATGEPIAERDAS